MPWRGMNTRAACVFGEIQMKVVLQGKKLCSIDQLTQRSDNERQRINARTVSEPKTDSCEMNSALYLIELRARGILEDIKDVLDGDIDLDRETERYLTTCAFALDRFIQYLEGEGSAV